MYYKYTAIAALCVVLLTLLHPARGVSDEERRARREGRIVITYWDRHTGHEFEARNLLFDEFNRSQDEVYVRALPIGYNALMEKLLTSIAGGSPPDVCALDGGMLVQLAAQGCFEPLDGFMASHKALRREAFFPHMWESVSLKGQIYGIPTTQDAYCLLWNKDAFRRAGLDPERPPRTMDELTGYAARLTIQNESGIEQIGFLPWLPWDHTAKLGALFGGRWYNAETGRMVCGEDERIIESLRWQRSFARKRGGPSPPPHALDPQKIMTFARNFGAYQSASNPFYMGKVAMIIEGEWQCTFIPKYAPDLDWGVAPIPQPEGTVPIAWSPTAIADCVPVGGRHPEAVYKFLAWFHSPRPGGGPSPASDYNHAIHNIPARPAEARQARFLEDPKFRVFVDVLTSRQVRQSPVMPASQFLVNEMEGQRERVVHWQIEPEEAMQELQEDVNAELERIRFLVRRRGQ